MGHLSVATQSVEQANTFVATQHPQPEISSDEQTSQSTFFPDRVVNQYDILAFVRQEMARGRTE